MIHNIVYTRRSLVVASLLLGSVVYGVPAFAAEVIRIGAPLPLTGALSPEGQKLQQGYDLWSEAVNARGGIRAGGKTYKVEMVYADYQSNTPRAVQLVDKLVSQDKVNFLFSPFGSGATKAASATSEKYGIPTVAGTASSAEVFDQGYKYLFGLFTPNDTLTEPLADLIKQKLSGKVRVAILSRNDLFPLALSRDAEKSAKKRDMEVVYSEKYAIGTLDHSSALAQIKSLKPDWLFVTGYTNDMILVRKQMSELGVNLPVVSMIIGPSYREFIEALGPLSENVLSATWWHPAVRYGGEGPFATAQAYSDSFRKKFGNDPDYTNAVGSLAGTTLQLAVEKAGSIEAAKVRDALVALKADTFFGPIAFGATGQANSYVPPVFQIQDKRPVAIYPDSIKTGDLKINPR
ncbi:amino acid ABC transporter substrate-binding protein [Bradyrhizobium sp. 5.13L]